MSLTVNLTQNCKKFPFRTWRFARSKDDPLCGKRAR
jgi:hypothetical protein